MRIFITTFSGNTFAFNVNQNDTIKSLKSKIEIEQRIPLREGILLLSGKPLIDTSCLSDYNIQDNTTLTLVSRSCIEGMLSFKTSTGKVVTIKADIENSFHDTNWFEKLDSISSQIIFTDIRFGECETSCTGNYTNSIVYLKLIVQEKNSLTVETLNHRNTKEFDTSICLNRNQNTGNIVDQDNNEQQQNTVKIFTEPKQQNQEIFKKENVKLGCQIEIFVTNYDLQYNQFTVTDSHTIKQLKDFFFTKYGVYARNQRLIYRGIDLEDDQKLTDYNIQNKSLILLLPQSTALFEINVKWIDGHVYYLMVASWYTIHYLNMMLEGITSVPYVHQELILNGLVLDGDRNLSYYNIKADTRIILRGCPL